MSFLFYVNFDVNYRKERKKVLNFKKNVDNWISGKELPLS